ncbi:MAG: hypothetical protein JSR83_26960 [Proteobacteria bacterium]|nr:hypothetical protein [Pseudomonadota bacterium]
MSRECRLPFPTGHREFSPGGWPRSAQPTSLALQIQFHAPVHFKAIRGLYGFTNQLEAPAIYWGRNGRCFAFLHDLTPEALARVMDDCRGAAHDRRQPWGA